MLKQRIIVAIARKIFDLASSCLHYDARSKSCGHERARNFSSAAGLQQTHPPNILASLMSANCESIRPSIKLNLLTYNTESCVVNTIVFSTMHSSRQLPSRNCSSVRSMTTKVHSSGSPASISPASSVHCLFNGAKPKSTFGARNKKTSTIGHSLVI